MLFLLASSFLENGSLLSKRKILWNQQQSATQWDITPKNGRFPTCSGSWRHLKGSPFSLRTKRCPLRVQSLSCLGRTSRENFARCQHVLETCAQLRIVQPPTCSYDEPPCFHILAYGWRPEETTKIGAPEPTKTTSQRSIYVLGRQMKNDKCQS